MNDLNLDTFPGLADALKDPDHFSWASLSPEMGRKFVAKLASKGDAGNLALLSAVKNGTDDIALAALLHLTKAATVSQDIPRKWVLKQLKKGTPAPSENPDDYAAQWAYEAKVNWLCRVMALAAQLNIAPIAEKFWPFLHADASALRAMTARALVSLGDPAVAPAIKLLEYEDWRARAGAVVLLGSMGAQSVLARIEAHLAHEDCDDVRDLIFARLDELWKSRSRAFPRAEIDRWVERRRLTEPVAPWLKEDCLPGLRDLEGKAFDITAVRYLMYRQSRVKDVPREESDDLDTGFVAMRPNATLDLEAAAMIKIIDRSNGAEFALELLEQFAKAKAKAPYRWALTLAGALGDARIIPKFVELITLWAERNWNQIAEHATRAFALLTEESALLEIDALSRRYRTRHKNVSEAARDAFAEIALRRGMSPDELGDLVVPTFGFAATSPCVFDCGKVKLEVRIGLDFKLNYFDPAKKKPVANVPKSAPPEIAGRLKETAAVLRDVSKAQIARLENHLIQQHRWKLERWRELYLSHPLLVPFGVRLVWGVYDQKNRLTATFRALGDGSLTSSGDSAFAFPTNGTVGIVHPLELAPSERVAWQNHLADHEIEAPFLQLSRPIHFPTQDEAGWTSLPLGGAVNVLSFKGKAQRAGWWRTGVGDGGMVPAYYKRFAAAGIDAVVTIQNLYIHGIVEEELEVEDVCFVRVGAIEIGGYHCTIPANAALKMLDVPALVFSEAIGDLNKILGMGRISPETGPL